MYIRYGDYWLYVGLKSDIFSNETSEVAKLCGDDCPDSRYKKLDEDCNSVAMEEVSSDEDCDSV